MNYGPTLVMIVGLSGAGKTTYAKKLCAKDGFEYVASDEVRRDLFGDDDPNVYTSSKNALVFNVCQRMAIKLLKEGKDVIFDATNLRSKYRVQTLEAIKNSVPNAYCVANVLIVPTNTCIAQNRQREYSVPQSVIEKQLRLFQLPVLGEGWNKIILITPDGYTFGWNFDEGATSENDVIMRFLKYRDFDQKNSNHTLSLYEHSKKTMKNVQSNLDYKKVHHDLVNESDVVIDAAMFHDFGKIFSQKIDLNGIGHYYNHENIGAYMYLESRLLPKEKLQLNGNIYDIYSITTRVYQTAFLINYHMMPFTWEKNEKLKKKYQKLFGEEMFNKLQILHDADVAAK